jgi:hypothetical protein
MAAIITDRHHCQHCHACGSPLRVILDGEEWCDTCRKVRWYESHGWGDTGQGGYACPDLPDDLKACELLMAARHLLAWFGGLPDGAQVGTLDMRIVARLRQAAGQWQAGSDD